MPRRSSSRDPLRLDPEAEPSGTRDAAVITREEGTVLGRQYNAGGDLTTSESTSSDNGSEESRMKIVTGYPFPENRGE